MDEQLRKIADHARAEGLYVAVAESLTCGAVASRLGAGAEASKWFRGGVVAYDESVKFDLLGVTPGPVVTESCAQELALGVARLLRADLAIGVTGVGGPDPSEGKPPGTVIVAATGPDATSCRTFEFSEDPEAVIAATVEKALNMLVEIISTNGPLG
jgi:nicotinamide-nucleotide amidase